MKKENLTTQKTVLRVGGKLREIEVIKNASGEIIHRIVKPLMVEFRLHDFVQIVIGAVLLAIPVGFTEEVWGLGQNLSVERIIVFQCSSIIFIGLFVYYNVYRNSLKQHFTEFIKRCLSVYIISFIVATLFLLLINKVSWFVDPLYAFKLTVLVAFPASLSAAVVDMIK